jgi:hypothetical protein
MGPDEHTMAKQVGASQDSATSAMATYRYPSEQRRALDVFAKGIHRAGSIARMVDVILRGTLVWAIFFLLFPYFVDHPLSFGLTGLTLIFWLGILLSGIAELVRLWRGLRNNGH